MKHDADAGRTAGDALRRAPAARLSTISRPDTQRILAECGIPLACDTADLDDDVAALERVGQT